MLTVKLCAVISRSSEFLNAIPLLRHGFSLFEPSPIASSQDYVKEAHKETCCGGRRELWQDLSFEHLLERLFSNGQYALKKWCSQRIYSYTEQAYIPTVLEDPHKTVTHEQAGMVFEISLWDTVSDGHYDRLRPLSYPGADVLLICFSLDSPDSLQNVLEKVVAPYGILDSLSNFAIVVS